MNAAQFKQLKEELKDDLKVVVKETVNGKIDKFHEEMTTYNEGQDIKLAEIKESVDGVVKLYNNSGAFFRAVIQVSKVVTAIGAMIAVIWACIKFIVLTALPR